MLLCFRIKYVTARAGVLDYAGLTSSGPVALKLRQIGWNPELELLTSVLSNSTNLAAVIPTVVFLIGFMPYKQRCLLEIGLNYIFCVLSR